MRRTLLSWPAKAVVLAVSAIWASGMAFARPSNLPGQYPVDLAATEGDWIPAGSVPIPPKPQVSDSRDSTGVDEYPSGAPVIPPKPKAHDDDETRTNEYPTGAPIVPRKPKLTSGIQY